MHLPKEAALSAVCSRLYIPQHHENIQHAMLCLSHSLLFTPWRRHFALEHSLMNRAQLEKQAFRTGSSFVFL
jgi:hypothetical protein